jgi:hypothetical protein
MTIILPLEPQDEAKLIAVAHAKGVSTDALVRLALDRILADAPRDSRFRIVRDVYGRRPCGGNAGFALQRDES